MARGGQALPFSLFAIRAVRRQRKSREEIGIDAGLKRLEAVDVEMGGLVEFDGNGTDPEIPMSNLVREVGELAVQLFVDPLDFASEVDGLDVLPSQARTKLNNRVSGVREEPGQVFLAFAQSALPSGC